MRKTAPAAFTLAVIVLGALLAFPAPVSAANNLVLSVSPLKLEFSADPGKRVSKEATVTNAGDATVTIGTSAMDFVADGDGGKPRFVPASTAPWSMSKWVKADPAEFEIGPRQSKRVTLLIDVPADAEPGGHYAAALFGSSAKAGQQTSVVAKVGTLLLVTVGGRVTEVGSIKLEGQRLFEKGPLSFDVRFANGGNVHVKPSGVLRISKLLGGKVAEVPIKGENVLPGSARSTEIRWKSAGSPNVYVAQAYVTYGKTGRKAVSEKRYVLLAPWRTILVGLALFGLGLATPWLNGLVRKKAMSRASSAEDRPSAAA